MGNAGGGMGGGTKSGTGGGMFGVPDSRRAWPGSFNRPYEIWIGKREIAMSRLFCLAALVFVGLAGSALAADEPEVASTADFEAILRRPVKVEFVDTPLSDVMDFFANKFDVNIILDSKGLADAVVKSSRRSRSRCASRFRSKLRCGWFWTALI